jgi:hypothetical protein
MSGAIEEEGNPSFRGFPQGKVDAVCGVLRSTATPEAKVNHHQHKLCAIIIFPYYHNILPYAQISWFFQGKADYAIW